MEIKKILMMGAPGSGKTTAMENVCEELLQTPNIEHGRLTINSRKISLLSYPKNKKWKYMQSLLLNSVDGVIIFVDNSIGFTEVDRELIKSVNQKGIPYVIFANKHDIKNEEPKINFTNATIIPTIAKDGDCIREALTVLLELISPYKEFVKTHPYVEIVKITN